MTTSNKKITIQDIVNEGKKPIQLKLDIGDIDYIKPTGTEVDVLEKEADCKITILREQHRTLYPNVPVNEEQLQVKKTTILTDLILWKGLNKADNTMTLEQLNEIPFEVKNQMNIQLNIMQLQNITNEQIGELKNLQQMMKV